MQGSTNLSLGPDHDPMYSKWTKVARNFIETVILEHKTKRGARSTPRVHEVDESRPKSDHSGAVFVQVAQNEAWGQIMPMYMKWTKVTRNETASLDGFLCRGHKT